MSVYKKLMIAISVCLVGGVFGCGPVDGNNVAGVSITEDVTSDMTLSGTNIIENRVSIKAQLTIEECSTIQVASGVIVDVDDGGSIVANGTEDCPVTFTSAKAGASAGDWNRLDIWDSSSNNNSFTHTVFEYGGGGDTEWGMMWVQSGANVSMSNVTFRDSEGRAAHFETGANIDGFSNVTVENLGREAFIIGPNEVGSLESLTANGEVPAIEIRGGALTDDQTWKALDIPYIVASRTGIEGALQIEPGTVVQVGPGVIIDVDNGGTIQASGTSEAPVTFTSSKASPASGDWGRFDIWESSGNANEFTYTTIEYGGSDPTYGAMWVDAGANVSLDNVTFSNNDGCDIDDNGTVNANATDYTACQ
jgi:hypothetical protein